MERLNERILQLKYKINERERLQNLTARLIEEQRKLEIKKSELYTRLKKEELDVEKLEGVSIAGLIHIIKGDKSEVLKKEKSEALAAKLKYDSTCSELQSTSDEIRELGSRISSFGDIDREYETAIKEKEQFVKSGQCAHSDELNTIIGNIAKYQSREKETSEALFAGRELLSSLDRVRGSLDSAEGWGTWDMFGGGFLATMAKHSSIDEAKREIDGAQSLLNRFHRELEDIGGSTDINIEIDSFLTFADYFFDGFFADWAVQSDIHDAQDKVNDTIEKARTIVLKLEGDLNYTENKLKALDKERLSIIEKA